MRNLLTQNRARTLRNHATDTEQYLWRCLRNHQLGGHRFRRQVPIGNYIADFACLEAKLIIELDGGQHQEQAEYDARRDSQMEAQGFRVLRFWDNQVFQETQAVLEVILRTLEERTSHHPACPLPSPPPQAEEGNKRPHPSLPPRYAQGKELKPLPPMPSPQSSPASGRGGERERQSSIPAGEGGDGGVSLPPLHAQRAGEGWGGGEP